MVDRMQEIKDREQRHKNAKTIDGLEYVKYKAQQEQEILELNTDEDKVTTITENNIIKKVRDVYGQRAMDMQSARIDWANYGVELDPKKRPNPYNYPAFERVVEDGDKKRGKDAKKGEKSHYKSSRRSKKPQKDKDVVVINDNSSGEYAKLQDELLFPPDITKEEKEMNSAMEMEEENIDNKEKDGDNKNGKEGGGGSDKKDNKEEKKSKREKKNGNSGKDGSGSAKEGKEDINKDDGGKDDSKDKK